MRIQDQANPEVRSDSRHAPHVARGRRASPSGAGLTTVFIVDDHAVVREGVRSLLDASGEFVVVGEAATADAALTGIIRTKPEIAIVDVRLPGGDGIEIVREVRSREIGTRCLILTSFSNETAFFQSVVAGAMGYTIKDSVPDELLEACRKIAAGESLITQKTLDDVRSRAMTPPDDDRFLSDLTPQERRILGYITEGLTNGEIAENLHLAEKTVRNYVSNVLTKLGLKNRTQAAVYVARSVARRGDRVTAGR